MFFGSDKGASLRASKYLCCVISEAYQSREERSSSGVDAAQEFGLILSYERSRGEFLDLFCCQLQEGSQSV